MSLIVKAYLKRGENVGKEIRRFSVDPTVAANYEYMSKKVAQVFPSLGNPNNFTLAWKDCDDDLITFSSDEELVEALGQREGDVFRIHVKERKHGGRGDGPSSFGQEEVFHPGVMCDGCESPIRGPRFKCIECPDYDLCRFCEEKGLHEEHQFVKFRHPQIGRSRCGGFGFRPGMWRAFGHPGFRHWWQQQQQQQQKQGFCGQEKPQQSEESKPNPEGGNENGPSPGAQAQGEFSGNFLRDIGESVAQMLDPLGIDVDIDVEHNGQRRKCQGGWGTGGGCGGGWGYGWGQGHGQGHGRGKGKKQHFKGKGKCNQSSSEEEEKKKQRPEEEEEEEETMQGAASGTEAGMAAATRAAAAALAAALMGSTGPASASPQEEQKDGTASEEMETDKGDKGRRDEADWTLLDQSSSNQPDTSSPSQSQPGQPTTDPSVQSEADKLRDMHISPHPDPRIANALGYMRAMGYDDEGGWLTRLLETKNGDINRSLDAIKFGQKQVPK